jgi:anthranilate synthase component 1
MIVTQREQFDDLAQNGARVPVYAEILADLETPVTAYWKLAHESNWSFLLESVTGGEHLARYSFIAADPDCIIRAAGREVKVVSPGNEQGESRTLTNDECVLDVLASYVLDKPYAHNSKLPKFIGGAVGFASYDLVRHFERLPDKNPDDLHCDDLCFMLCPTIVAFDHAQNRILVISNALQGEYDLAVRRIQEVVEKLRRPLPDLPSKPSDQLPAFESNMKKQQFEDAVREAVNRIALGEGVQFVLSQRFSSPSAAPPISIYRALRSINPSPYMYLLNLNATQIVGASPEILVSYERGIARVRPIAGTRRRGMSDADDQRLECELLSDEKERAEHIMLVDLGRNDLGRIAKPGGVRLNEFMTIEKYSHVMHIVSDVSGEVREDANCFDVFKACFPAGTVSGAPKVRAMEIIDELETSRRGLYAGAVGYFGFDGEMDMAIAIRTILIKNGIAHIQAGAGIVYDSVPENEWQECRNKAEGVFLAVEMAHKGFS